MEPRIRSWTVGLLAAAGLNGIWFLRYYLDQAGDWRLAKIGLVAGLAFLALATLVLLLARRRLEARHLSWVAAALFALVAVAPAAGKAAGRVRWGPERMTLDSILQVEIAAGMIAERRNPYREDYFGTDLEKWNRGRDVPSMRHFVYPPLPALATVPAREAGLRAFGVYDSRFLLIPVLLGSFLFCWFRWRGTQWRAALLAVTFLNPLSLSAFHVGRWDTLVLLFWILAMSAFAKGRGLQAALWLALAAMTKTPLLAAGIFGLAYVARSWREGLRWCAVYAAPLALILGPFLAWDARALYDDMVAATAGLGPHPFPITDAGLFGVGGLVLTLGWVNSPTDFFPFWIAQAPVLAALLVAGVRTIRKEPSIASVGVGTALVVGAYFFLGRFSDPAYFGTLISMAAVSWGFDQVKSPSLG